MQSLPAFAQFTDPVTELNFLIDVNDAPNAPEQVGRQGEQRDLFEQLLLPFGHRQVIFGSA